MARAAIERVHSGLRCPTTGVPMPPPDRTNPAGSDPAVTHSLADPAATTGGESPHTADRAGPPPSPGRYLLGDEIARGGMGEVYRSTDTVLARDVAVKVLQAKFGPTSAAARRFTD